MIARSVLAVGAGFFSTQILSLAGDVAYSKMVPAAFEVGTRDAGTLIVMLVYGALAGFIGAYIATLVAARRPVAHTVAVGLICLVSTIANTVLSWDAAPLWYHAVTLLLVVPVAVLAGKVREMQVKPTEA